MTPNEPEAPEPKAREFEDSSKESELAPEAPRTNASPDWLVGPDEGASAELLRNRSAERHAPLRLVRPGETLQAPDDESDEPEAPRAVERLSLMRHEDTIRSAMPASASRKPKAAQSSAWQAAASSIPTLRRTASSAPAKRAPSREFEQDEKTPMPELPDDSAAHALPPPELQPLKEAWWLVALDAVQTNRRLQIALASLLLMLGILALQPWRERPASLARIRRHPQQYDGRTVSVRGRVGDVFPIAGGFTYFLLSGRDTIVVFTHSHSPVMDQHLTVHGTISTGYLDGLPRQALFEDLP